MIEEKKKKAFQGKVLSWYEANKRDLPWRKTTDPYQILISEVMLQQTQVDRVIPYYERWLKALPDFESLAKVDKLTLLKLWSGLGYNNRALRLQKLAQAVIGKYKGQFPEDEQELLSLPGIGPYTASAVLAFVFNKETAVIDTNIRRVLIHELNLKEDTSQEELKRIALQCVPEGKSCIWHNALMDYGALEKTARKTGIQSLSKQPEFEGSERKVRGEIVKYLLEKKEAAIAEIKEKYNHENFEKIIEKMEKDGLIRKGASKISIR